MSEKSWTLLDATTNEHLTEPATLSVPGVDGMSIRKTTHRGGLADGVSVVEVENGALSFRILPTRGMGLWDVRVGSWRIGWDSPIAGPVHPQFVDLGEPSGLGWLDGFDELLVRCGLESNGAPDFDEQGRLRYPLHGRIANRPANRVEAAIDAERGELRVTGVVEEARFLLRRLRLTSTYTARQGQNELTIRDEVENLSASNSGMQLLYHVNFGSPLLEAGAQLVVPAKTVVPRDERAAEDIATWESYGAPLAGYSEQVYFLDLYSADDGTTGALLKNAHGTNAVSLRFNKRQLPCFTLWKHTSATQDGYLTGLEPATNYPNPRSYEEQQGRVLQLEPGEKAVFEMALSIHLDQQEVTAAQQQIRQLAGDRKPAVFDQPQPGWSR